MKTPAKTIAVRFEWRDQQPAMSLQAEATLIERVDRISADQTETAIDIILVEPPQPARRSATHAMLVNAHFGEWPGRLIFSAHGCFTETPPLTIAHTPGLDKTRRGQPRTIRLRLVG